MTISEARALVDYIRNNDAPTYDGTNAVADVLAHALDVVEAEKALRWMRDGPQPTDDRQEPCSRCGTYVAWCGDEPVVCLECLESDERDALTYFTDEPKEADNGP